MFGMFTSSWQPSDLREAPHTHMHWQGRLLPTASFFPSTVKIQSSARGTDPPRASGGKHRSHVGGQVSPRFNTLHKASSEMPGSTSSGNEDANVRTEKDTMRMMTTIKITKIRTLAWVHAGFKSSFHLNFHSYHLYKSFSNSIADIFMELTYSRGM